MIMFLKCITMIIFSKCSSSKISLADRWYAIRASTLELNYNYSGEMFTTSVYNFENVKNDHETILASIPGTVLSSLLINNTFAFSEPFLGEQMKFIPDINETGHEFYTFWFFTEFDIASVQSKSILMNGKYWLIFSAINYYAEVYLNGFKLNNNQHQHLGMFRRHKFDITNYINKSIKNHLTVLVHPPIHTGSCRHGGQGGDHQIARNGAIQQSTAGWDWIQCTPDRNTGIWDDVYLLYTPSYVTLHNTSLHTLSVCNPASITSIMSSHDSSNCNNNSISSAKLRLVTTIQNELSTDVFGTLLLTISDPSTETSKDVYFSNTSIFLSVFEVRQMTLEDILVAPVKLWWPFSHGVPFLYSVTVQFIVDQSLSDVSVEEDQGHDNTTRPFHSHEKQQSQQVSESYLSYTVSFRHGMRVITSDIHAVTKGRYFLVNNVPIFLVGGNWITTDQFLRFSSGSKLSIQRYRNEVRMHREMGINLIRVWGGGIAERDAFYEACDEMGVLVMQEFWMTGDNNGRWAGSFDWPDDHAAYIANVEDTVLRLRSHASLMLWCGGNELHPLGKNPPGDIAAAISELVARLDPGRPFIMSSMSPQNPDPKQFDATFALAPNDGPYQILPISVWYSHRNPGLPAYENASISFQPEVGSVSTPVAASMRKFLSTSSLLAFPRDGARIGEVDSAWDYHKYLEYTSEDWAPLQGPLEGPLEGPVEGPLEGPLEDELTSSSDKGSDLLDFIDKSKSRRARDRRRRRSSHMNTSSQQSQGTRESFQYDHIYAYGDPDDIDGYCWRAQLVQYAQYRAIIEGYTKHQWEYYSAVLIWKSQSPWPTLRGALYDYYLEQTGGFYGVQIASKTNVHIVMHPTTFQVYIINRLVFPIKDLKFQIIVFNMKGRIFQDEVIHVDRVDALSVSTFNSLVLWPDDYNDNDIEKTGRDHSSTKKHLFPNVYFFQFEILRYKIIYSQQTDSVTQGYEQNTANSHRNIYWLTHPNLPVLAKRRNYASLGLLRAFHRVELEVSACWIASNDARNRLVNVSLHLPKSSSHIAFMVVLGLGLCNGTVDSSQTATGFSRLACSDFDRLLPVWYSSNYITLLPGEDRWIVIDASDVYVESSHDVFHNWLVKVDGWNIIQKMIKLLPGL